MARQPCTRPATALPLHIACLVVASATEVFDFTGGAQGPTITLQRPVVESHWTIEGAIPTENLYKTALAESLRDVIQDVVGAKGNVILRSSSSTSLEMQVLCHILPEPMSPDGANDVQTAIVNYPLQSIQTLLYSHLYAHPHVPDAVVTDLIGRIIVEKGFQSWVYRSVTILDGTYNETYTTTRTETTTTEGAGGGGATTDGDGGASTGDGSGSTEDGNATTGGAENGTGDAESGSSDGGGTSTRSTTTGTTFSDTTTTSTTSTTVTTSRTTTLRTTSTRTTTTVTTSSFAAAAWVEDSGGDFFSSMFDISENPWGFAVVTFVVLSVACSICFAASRCGCGIQLYPATAHSQHHTKVRVLKNFNAGSALPRAESLDSVTLASDGAKWAARNLRLIRVAPAPEEFVKPDVEAGLRSAAAAHLQHDKAALALPGTKPTLAITAPTDGAETPNTVSTIALSVNADSMNAGRSSFSLSHHSSLATPVGGRTPISSPSPVGSRTPVSGVGGGGGGGGGGSQSPMQGSPRPSCGSRGVSPRPVRGSKTLAPRPLGR